MPDEGRGRTAVGAGWCPEPFDGRAIRWPCDSVAVLFDGADHAEDPRLEQIARDLTALGAPGVGGCDAGRGEREAPGVAGDLGQFVRGDGAGGGPAVLGLALLD